MRILVIDDHALFRNGLAMLLRDLYPGVEIVETGRADKALEIVADHADFDVVLLDLALPGMNGFDGLMAIRERLPGVPVIIISSSETRADVSAAFRCGAKGYVLKSSTYEVLKHALPLVLAGEVYIPGPAMTGAEPMPGGNSGGGPRQGAEVSLTPRQQEVLALIAAGKSNKQIARSLGMLEGTVKVHVKAILQRLGVTNRTQAVIMGSKLGCIPRSSIL